MSDQRQPTNILCILFHLFFNSANNYTLIEVINTVCLFVKAMALTEIEDEQTGDEAKEQNTFGERKTRDRKNRKEKVKPLTKVCI